MAAAMAHRVKHLYSNTVLQFPTWADSTRQYEENAPLAGNALLMQEAIDTYFVKMIETMDPGRLQAYSTLHTVNPSDIHYQKNVEKVIAYGLWDARRSNPSLGLQDLYQKLFSLMASQYRIMDSRAFLRVHEAAPLGARMMVSIRQ